MTRPPPSSPEAAGDVPPSVRAPALTASWGVPLVEWWTVLGSTNDRAAELSRRGGGRGAVVVADEQTEGRGRRGASWLSVPGGGVWMSIVLDEADSAPQLPLLVGVACAEALEQVCPGLGVGVKWPNDLLVGGRKVGGVLVERAGGPPVVGIGVNVRVPQGGFPADLGGSATALEAEVESVPARERLAEAIVRRVLLRLDSEEPVGDALSALAARDALYGREVMTEQAGEGVAVGVDPTGALLLERADGTRVSVVSGRVRSVPGPGR